MLASTLIFLTLKPPGITLNSALIPIFENISFNAFLSDSPSTINPILFWNTAYFA
jgi:hypothetical protein